MFELNRKDNRITALKICAVLALGVLSMAGCTTSPESLGPDRLLFWPLPPEQPIIQYLASYSTSSDLSGPTGWFKKFIVGEPAEKPLVKPYGFAVWNDAIYVCDTMLAAVAVLDFRTREIRYITPVGAGRLLKPINIAIDEAGMKYIADPERGDVVVLDASDRYVGRVTRDGGFKPTDVAITQDRLYVADLQNRDVGVWNRADLSYLLSIPSSFHPDAKLYSPTNIALDNDGNVYVSDIGAAHVVKYDSSGAYQATFGSRGDGLGQFVRPKGIDVDPDGRLYVVDSATDVAQIFDAGGNLLLFFGESQDGSGLLSLPASIRIDSSLLPYFEQLAEPTLDLEYLIIVSSQYGPNKITVFGFSASGPQ